MVRLRIQFNISEKVTSEMKDEFNNLTDKMSKESHLDPSSSKDEDLEWLKENEFAQS